jgi:hypothetical protein
MIAEKSGPPNQNEPATLDAYQRDSAAREPTKQRRLNGADPVKRQLITIE